MLEREMGTASANFLAFERPLVSSVVLDSRHEFRRSHPPTSFPMWFRVRM